VNVNVNGFVKSAGGLAIEMPRRIVGAWGKYEKKKDWIESKEWL
jgi:hypothetical protein